MVKANETVTKDFLSRVKKYIKNHGENPKRDLLPHLILKWERRDGYHYKDTWTGKEISYDNYITLTGNIHCRHQYGGFRQNKNRENTFFIPAQVHYQFPYCRIDYNLKVVEFSATTIDTRVTHTKGINYSFIGDRHFFDLNNKKLWCHIPQYEKNPVLIENGYAQNVPQGYYSRWYERSVRISTWISSSFFCLNNIALENLKKVIIHQGEEKIYLGACSYREPYVEVKNATRWEVSEYFRRAKNAPNSNRNTDTIEKLQNMKLPELNLTKDDLVSYSKPRYSYESTKRSITVVQNINENLTVFREFNPYFHVIRKRTHWHDEYECYSRYLNQDYRTMDDDMLIDKHVFYDFLETERIFVYDGKIYRFFKYFSSEFKEASDYKKCEEKAFVYDASINSVQNISRVAYIKNVEELEKDSQFKYYKDFVKNGTNNHFLSLFTSMKQPIIEQLLKMKCPKLAYYLADNNEFKANSKKIVGEVNVKKKNATDFFGMNSKQIKIIEEWVRDPSDYDTYRNGQYFDLNLLGFIYEITSGKNFIYNYNNIAHLDIENFKTLFSLTRELYTCNVLHRPWWYGNFRGHLVFKNSIENLVPPQISDIYPTSQHKLKYIQRILKMCQKANIGFNVVVDNKTMYNRLDNEYLPENVNFDYQCASDIMRLHDSLVELIRIQDEERTRLRQLREDERNKELEKKMAKLDEKRREMEFEDDEYLIRIPRKLSELTTEGTVQRICIGSYINAHAAGNSNIFFLRKKSDPDTPFFAIEEKSNRIIQIHGYCNKWLGADDESFASVPFVMRWLKKHNLSCDSEILTSMAQGYGCGNRFRQLPKIED